MIVVNRWLPVRGFSAINLFGIIFVRKGVAITPVLLRHEHIHTRQQRELLWLGFYLWYILEYLYNIIIYRNRWKAYRNIRFEREAYAHESDFYYLKKRRWYAFLNNNLNPHTSQ